MLRQAGHEATDVRDVGLGTATDADIAAYAAQHRLCILTKDFDFGDIRKFSPKEHAGIVILSLPKDDDGSTMILYILDRFLSDMPPSLQGRLFIVDKDRTRER